MPATNGSMIPPTTVENISVSWLRSILGHQVRSFDITNYISNQTTGKVYLTLTCEDGADITRPEHICLKGPFDRETMTMEGYTEILIRIYTREVKFFELVAPKLKTVRLPKVWGTATRANPPVTVIAMDNLSQKGYTFGAAADAWTVKRVLSGAEQLAPCTPGRKPDSLATWRASTNMITAQTRGACPSRTLRASDPSTRRPWWRSRRSGTPSCWARTGRPCPARSVAALKKHFPTKNPRFLCLLHGDPHPSNTVVDRDDSPSFLDWQTCHVGSAFHDFAYFMIGSLSVADWRAHEMEILEHYLRALAKCGGGPTLAGEDEEVVREYKKCMMAGLGWILTPYALQPKARVMAMVGRYSAAFVDHKVIELVGSLSAPEKQWVASDV